MTPDSRSEAVSGRSKFGRSVPEFSCRFTSFRIPELGGSFFFSHWSTIALQCCVSFCHATEWISREYTYIPSFFTLPPTYLQRMLKAGVFLHSVFQKAGSFSFSLTWHKGKARECLLNWINSNHCKRQEGDYQLHISKEKSDPVVLHKIFKVIQKIRKQAGAKTWIPWCRERLRTGEEAGDRGWDGWVASPTQRTWVWRNSGT